MKKNKLFSSFFAIIGLFSITYQSHAQGGGIECSTPDEDPSDYQDFLNDLITNKNNSGGVVAGGVTGDVYIPIRIFVINDDNSLSPTGSPSFDHELDGLLGIEATNAFFDNGMVFYLCGVT